MKFYFSGLIVLSLLLSATAKPGETYILTGREKSVFGIFQADLKAYPDLYKGEDNNAYYQAFKALNNLEGRKLKRGEELMFPHTLKSKELADAEAAIEQEKKAEAERKLKRETAAANSEPAESSESDLSLFGSDTRSSPMDASPDARKARAKAQRERIRYNAVYHFQHTQLPLWLCDPGNTILEHIENGNMDALLEKALEKVDTLFAEALVLHPYPDKNIYVLEFEKPQKMEGLFFLAIKREESGPPHIYALEKGLSVFGTGNVSIFSEYKSDETFSELGGRTYMDLASFLREIETIR